MKTNDLISALSQDLQPTRPFGATVALALIAAIVIAALVFFVTIGPRPDIAAAAETYRFLSKFLVTGLLAASAVWLVDRLARPGALGRTDFLVLLAPVVTLAVLVVIEMFTMPPPQWAMATTGKNSAVCLTYIPLIGLGPLALMILVLRRGAVTRPVLAGAVAGLAAGGIAATLYAAHCPDDSPFFVAVWYPLAIAMLTAAGALLGRLFARF
jgi:hypothetical protein